MPFPLDQKYVRQCEEKLGYKLPLSYVARMCKSNGGEIQTADDRWWLYPIFDSTDRKRVARTCNDVAYETNQYRSWLGFPKHAVAIAGNGTGDQLVFIAQAPSERLGDEIYFWDHETGELTKVADDFLDFFDTDE